MAPLRCEASGTVLRSASICRLHTQGKPTHVMADQVQGVEQIPLHFLVAWSVLHGRIRELAGRFPLPTSRSCNETLSMQVVDDGFGSGDGELCNDRSVHVVEEHWREQRT